MGSNAVKTEDKEPENRIQQLAREDMSEISDMDPARREETLGTFISVLFFSGGTEAP